MEAEGEGWDPVKLAEAHTPPLPSPLPTSRTDARVIHYWPF